MTLYIRTPDGKDHTIRFFGDRKKKGWVYTKCGLAFHKKVPGWLLVDSLKVPCPDCVNGKGSGENHEHGVN